MASMSNKNVALGMLPVMATAFLASCGDDETAYCTNPQNQVVDNSYCDDDFDGSGGGYVWAFVAGSALSRGSLVPRGAERIAPSNRAALARKGGFGSSARSSGVGRSVKSSGGGFSSGGG